MARVLVLGAGFSKNWGGLVAGEAFNFLMSSALLDDVGKALLMKHKDGSFEAALDELQAAHLRGDGAASVQLTKLEGAVAQMFEAMDLAFRNRPSGGFEFSNDMALSVAAFLARFDAIFTLNQDVLLERYYIGQAQQTLGAHHRSGVIFPGMRALPKAGFAFEEVGVWVPTDPLDMVVAANFQPIYKLHGSVRWRTNDGQPILIMGGGKTMAINRFPVLKASFDAFDRYLAMPDLRLMMVGYGFGDDHVTQRMTAAAEAPDAKTFFVDPWGIDACDPLAKRTVPTLRMARPINALQARCAGAVQEPLSTVFSQRGVSFQLLTGFLD
jgi:hypothetical protein